jgi:hypothetical protein
MSVLQAFYINKGNVMKSQVRKSFGDLPPRYSFALNPDVDAKMSKCLICDCNTFKRKFPLVIFVKDAPILSLGLTCSYCAKCEFIIAHQYELEHELCIAYEKIDPSQIGNDYLVIGTMDKKIWKKGLNVPSAAGTLDSIADFKEYMTIKPGGWLPTQ